MEKNKGMEFLNNLDLAFIQASFQKTKYKDLVNLLGIMEKNTKEIGKMEKCMGKEPINIWMEMCIKDILNMIKDLVLAF